MAVSLAGVVSSPFFATHVLEPRLHRYIVETVSHSLESEVELGRTTITWFPLRVRASGLTVRHHGRTDVPPLLVLQSFSVDVRWNDLWDHTADLVLIDGMEINIPPRQGAGPRIPHPGSSADRDGKGDAGPGALVRRLRAANVRLSVMPRNPDKNPKVWDLHSLEMTDLQSKRPAPYVASLINPIPFGHIESTGEFGPWSSDEPSDTPLKGQYTFSADLGTIDGLGGHLDAKGTMHGLLERLDTEGTTSTSAFSLTSLHAQSLPLMTRYTAVVDGTKGDVELKRVDVTLGSSRLVAQGTIAGTKGMKGKRVVLNVTTNALDVGDVLRLLTKSTSPKARGTLIVDVAMDLPQGKADIIDKLEVAGSIRAERVEFMDHAIQDRVDQLSRTGLGRPKDLSIDDVASKMTSSVALKKGVLQFKNLTFDVDGTSVHLNGTHSLKPKTLDLAGEVRLRAPISKTQTGYKTWLLKPLDPLFRHRGVGARLSITVQGTSEQPVVGIDLKKSIKGG